jgi:hypothetical protein
MSVSEKRDPLPPGMANKIMQAGWPAVDGKIDEEFGSAVVKRDSSIGCNARAVWTTEGKRITVLMGSGTFIVSQSKDIDPIYANEKGEKR